MVKTGLTEITVKQSPQPTGHLASNGQSSDKIAMLQSAFEPIDFHAHGSGSFDFAKPHEVQLDEIEVALAKERVSAILTFFVSHSRFAAFENLCRTYGRMRKNGALKRILGIASEGPLLASVGGTPEKSSWLPTKVEWQRFAALGEHGFIYAVLSPDFDFSKSSGSRYPQDMNWIVDALMSNGVMPALGHFLRSDPEHSAACARLVFDRIEKLGQGVALTDHLYNDMPLNFKHAWRTRRQRESMDRDLVEAELDGWCSENLETTVGEVPAAIIRAAWDGLVKICLNFDGAHVDGLVCKRTVDLVGAQHLILMTDRINSGVLAGERLVPSQENSLLHQKNGIVAGGSCPAWKQVENMAGMGLKPDEINRICYENAIDLLSGRNDWRHL